MARSRLVAISTVTLVDGKVVGGPVAGRVGPPPGAATFAGLAGTGTPSPTATSVASLGEASRLTSRTRVTAVVATYPVPVARPGRVGEGAARGKTSRASGPRGTGASLRLGRSTSRVVRRGRLPSSRRPT